MIKINCKGTSRSLLRLYPLWLGQCKFNVHTAVGRDYTCKLPFAKESSRGFHLVQPTMLKMINLINDARGLSNVQTVRSSFGDKHGKEGINYEK